MITQAEAESVAAAITGTSSRITTSKEAIVADLMGINVEEAHRRAGLFLSIRYDEGNEAVVIRTEPIVLEGVNLGSFDLYLFYNQYGYDGEPNRVCRLEAVEPHPYAPEGKPHPHIMYEHELCYGEGSRAASSAIIRGDIVSHARIVNAILHVYNPLSPYAYLTAYLGPQCYDCGGTVITRSREAAQAGVRAGFQCMCQRQVCGNCTVTCRGCQSRACADCALTVTLSNGTQLSYCRGCGPSCCKCGRHPSPRHAEYSYREGVSTRYQCHVCLEESRRDTPVAEVVPTPVVSPVVVQEARVVTPEIPERPLPETFGAIRRANELGQAAIDVVSASNVPAYRIGDFTAAGHEVDDSDDDEYGTIFGYQRLDNEYATDIDEPHFPSDPEETNVVPAYWDSFGTHLQETIREARSNPDILPGFIVS